MEVVCEKLEYLRGGIDLSQGNARRPHEGFAPGAYAEYNGYGWWRQTVPSRLIVHAVAADGSTHEILVDRFFKDRVGRLTEKRRTIIAGAMPQTVRVEEHTGRRGRQYYAIPEADLEAWLERTGLQSRSAAA